MSRPEFTNDDDAFHAFNDLMTTQGGNPGFEHEAADEFVRDLLTQNGFPKLAAALAAAAQDWWYE